MNIPSFWTPLVIFLFLLLTSWISPSAVSVLFLRSLKVITFIWSFSVLYSVLNKAFPLYLPTQMGHLISRWHLELRLSNEYELDLRILNFIYFLNLITEGCEFEHVSIASSQSENCIWYQRALLCWFYDWRLDCTFIRDVWYILILEKKMSQKEILVFGFLSFN